MVRSPDQDVVVVGGGPAGLVTALAIAKLDPALAKRTVVVERHRYPRDKCCAGAVGRRGERFLEALEAVPDVPSVPIRGMTITAAGRCASVDLGVPVGRVVRRREFDDVLATTARKRELRVLDGVRVLGIEETRDGVSIETDAGSLTSRVVVGADGVASIVRRTMGLAEPEVRAQVLEVDTPVAHADGSRSMLSFDLSDRRFRGYTWAFPTLVGSEPAVCRGVYVLRSSGESVDLPALLEDELARRGLRFSDCSQKRYAERGYAPRTTLASSRLLLAGEAAGIDPATGEGIAQAIEFGCLAGRFLVEHVRTGRSLSEWTSRVARSRLGIDLALRSLIARAAYGSMRDDMERLVTTPTFVRAGCQHFGGLRPDPIAALRSLGAALRAGTRWTFARRSAARA